LEDKIEVGWPQEIKKILDDVGYSYFWNEGKGSNLDTVVDKVNERLHEQEIQQWQAWREALEFLSLYSKVKETWGKKFVLSWG